MRRLAAGVLLVLLAACGDGEPAPQAVRESAGQETTTSTVAPTTTTAAPGRTTTTRAGARTTTTRAAGGATTTAPAPAGTRALAPATPGTYRYDTAGATTFAGNTTPVPGGDHAWSSTPRRAPASGPPATCATPPATVCRPSSPSTTGPRACSSSPCGVTTGFSGITDVRDLRPASPVLLLATGAGPGAHREADLTGTSPAKLVVDVLREERLTIAGQAVDTLVMRIVVTLAPGDVTGRQELTVNVDRGSRLWVKERSVTDASAAGGLFTAHSEYTATHPAPHPLIVLAALTVDTPHCSQFGGGRTCRRHTAGAQAPAARSEASPNKEKRLWPTPRSCSPLPPSPPACSEEGWSVWSSVFPAVSGAQTTTVPESPNTTVAPDGGTPTPDRPARWRRRELPREGRRRRAPRPPTAGTGTGTNLNLRRTGGGGRV